MAGGCCGSSDRAATASVTVDLGGRPAPGSTDQQVRESVQEYYGRVLQTKADLKTGACCDAEAPPVWQRAILDRIDPEIHAKFYGCGSPIPPALEGCTVLDLGCGTGRDSYVCSYLVGESGRVIGIDMTEEQLEVARRHRDAQAAAFGFRVSNVDFREGYIEDLAAAGIEDDSVDVVISNCVLNLSPDKPAVFREIVRVLKPGGELYFSDVFADRRIPEALRRDPVLHGECLAGAMYIEDFRRLLLDLGIRDYRVVASRPFAIDDPGVHALIGGVGFTSQTLRAFKILDFEDRCEDYGQVAWYQGTIPHAPHRFPLDAGHVFETGRPVPICANVAAVFERTRLAPHFRVAGDRRIHLGVMDCAAPAPRIALPGPTAGEPAAPGGACCG